MTEFKNTLPDSDNGDSLNPPGNIFYKVLRRMYDFLASVKLAMALLIIILACCLVGVTIIRGERAWVLIFNTLWFNGILVLLVLNITFCFFGRIQRRLDGHFSFFEGSKNWFPGHLGEQEEKRQEDDQLPNEEAGAGGQ